MSEALKKPTNQRQLEREHKQVLSLLGEGLENTVTAKYIVKLTGFSNTRVRRIIRELIIDHGYIIGASNQYGSQGFYIPATPDEEDACLNNLTSRLREISKRERALKKNILSKRERR